ncbi:MAG: DUF1501 domain-containing protein [Planctomycetota bacterium]|nr:DUF1501 domain-containing protein [Planctomycetota bacterium]
MKKNPGICPGPVSRREFLQAGSLGIAGLGLHDLLRLRAAAGTSGGSQSDTSVIFIWLPGGPPHMEMYDMKPDAPSDYRGDFQPIATKVSGLDVCELMPLHAKIADKYNIVRSIAHKFADHGGGHKRFLTGRIPKKPDGFVNDNPMVGSIVSRVRENRPNASGLYDYIVMGDGRVNSVDTFSFGSAYLGTQTHPFRISADPNEDGFQIKNLSLVDGVSERRLDDRTALLHGLDRLRRDVDLSGVMEGSDSFNSRALDMVTSPEARAAFDLSREPDKLRDRYGRHQWGQRALLARRLVEAEVSWVTVVMENPFVSGVHRIKNGVYNWDSHAVNCHLFDDARVRLPIYDRAITALIEDLHNRGLDKKVLLVVTGEFGRTPRIKVSKGSQTGVDQPGRDHWPNAMSLLVTGGGMRTGQVIGSTNAKGEHPVERPFTPNDLWATVYRHLGIDDTQTFDDHNGRPMPILPFGEPIAELM